MDEPGIDNNTNTVDRDSIPDGRIIRDNGWDGSIIDDLSAQYYVRWDDGSYGFVMKSDKPALELSEGTLNETI